VAGRASAAGVTTAQFSTCPGILIAVLRAVIA